MIELRAFCCSSRCGGCLLAADSRLRHWKLTGEERFSAYHRFERRQAVA